MSRRHLVLPVVASLALAACSAPAGGDDDDRVRVLAAFYPLQYVAEQVGGPGVAVDSLTPPGAEPHDLELSPRRSRDVATADVVVTLHGFQPAVDEVVGSRQPAHLVDAAEVPAVAEHLGEAQEGAADDGHDHAGGDPHFWLDPTLLAEVGHAVADALGEADPAGAAGYAERADALAADLADLDTALAQGLAECERDVVVTAHEAFGFLAERYGFQQVGVSGLDPEAEPSPARLREVKDVVEEHGMTTVFTEVLVDPAVAETLADDLGIDVAVLDPVESRPEGQDYREAMTANLEALRGALGCR